MKNYTLIIALSFITQSSLCAYANTVTTSCGSSVYHLHKTDWTTEWSLEQKAIIKAELEFSFPDITVIGEASKLYNCHSFAWAGSTEWIDNPGPYLDSYALDAANGHQLTYYKSLSNSPAHSAVDNIALDYTATSKWGDSCLVIHDWDDTPSIYHGVNSIYKPAACGSC